MSVNKVVPLHNLYYLVYFCVNNLALIFLHLLSAVTQVVKQSYSFTF